MDTVVEIFAEPSGADHLLQRLMGCADEAEVDLAVGAAAQTLHLAVFQNAQQLGLQVHRQSGDLVQEKRAFVGQLDLARTRLCGSGKGAAFAAEEFRFDEVLRQGCAVEADMKAYWRGC